MFNFFVYSFKLENDETKELGSTPCKGTVYNAKVATISNHFIDNVFSVDITVCDKQELLLVRFFIVFLLFYVVDV